MYLSQEDSLLEEELESLAELVGLLGKPAFKREFLWPSTYDSKLRYVALSVKVECHMELWFPIWVKGCA